MTAPDTIHVFVPLKLRKKNGRPKILPPADYLPSADRTEDPHILRAIGRAWGERLLLRLAAFADTVVERRRPQRYYAPVDF